MNKVIGIALLITSLIALFTLYLTANALSDRIEGLGCYPTDECESVQTSLNSTHLLSGVIGFLLSLGIYLLIMPSKEIPSNNTKINTFEILLKGLEDGEKEVMKTLNAEEGLSQSMLAYKTGLSKSKISAIVKNLEGKKLLKRVKKGKKLLVYLKKDY